MLTGTFLETKNHSSTYLAGSDLQGFLNPQGLSQGFKGVRVRVFQGFKQYKIFQN